MTVEVIQADREAAADAFDCRVLSNGRYDNDSRVQAFARHRIAHQGQASAVKDSLTGDVAELVQQIGGLIETRKVFVTARCAMNAAIPAIDATPAERALYDERYRADHTAERNLFAASLNFATWATDNEAAAKLTELAAEVERLRRAIG